MMIKKVIGIEHGSFAEDRVELGWFDRQKPHLTAISDKGIEFIVKTSVSHLHAHDVLVCEDGYKIEVHRAKDSVVKMTFDTCTLFAKAAYEVGNRHQPICLQEQCIIVLNDSALVPLFEQLQGEKGLHMEITEDYFIPTGKGHHAH
jgi:urease accessory protein